MTTFLIPVLTFALWFIIADRKSKELIKYYDECTVLLESSLASWNKLIEKQDEIIKLNMSLITKLQEENGGLQSENELMHSIIKWASPKKLIKSFNKIFNTDNK